MITMYDIGNTVYFLDCDRPTKGVVRAIRIEDRAVIYEIRTLSGVTHTVSARDIFTSAKHALVALKSDHEFELRRLKEKQAEELEEFKQLMED